MFTMTRWTIEESIISVRDLQVLLRDTSRRYRSVLQADTTLK